MCGKNLDSQFRATVSPGSPPRVREKLKGGRNSFKSSGITPACAGKTPGPYARAQFYGDHPRVCGKNDDSILLSKKTLGSPPRVREKRNTLTYETVKSGITPACAGKTSSGTIPLD